MVYFDLNIPYSTNEPKNPTVKTSRLKLTIQALTLNYSAIAYNRIIKNVMSESDRCSTPLFPISSIMKQSASIAKTRSIHNECGNDNRMKSDNVFRQYSRVTVVVQNSAQGASLNSGNPILKSYDIVGVRPMNQLAFDQACTASEVDLISIDFCEKLPFRLKQPMVKAAIERGVYFEIAYSGLLMDVQLRRQMITNTKLLVDWTRGKNLIISSAATSVTEMRGPYDVANLCLLLGLSMENAKAALSKNCRSLITKALRKKYFYKEAVRVEIVPSGEEFDSTEHWPKDWMKWDPISSGEGDLFLDDLAKSFSAANKVANTMKPIDFTSIIDKLPSQGLQVQKLRPVREATIHFFETESSVADTEPKELVKTFLELSKDGNQLHIGSSQHQIYSCEDSVELISPTHIQGCVTHDEKIATRIAEEVEHNDSDGLKTPTQIIEEVEHTDSDGLDLHVSPLDMETLCLQSQNCLRRCDTQVEQLDSMATTDSSLMVIDTIDTHEAACNAENSSGPIDNVFLLPRMRTSSHSSTDICFQDNEMKSIPTEIDLDAEEDLPLTSCETNNMDNGQLKEITFIPEAVKYASPVGVSYGKDQNNDNISTKEFSLVRATLLKSDLSQTLCDSNGENSRMQKMKDYPAPVVVPILVSQDEINCSGGHIAVVSDPTNEMEMVEQKESGDHAQSSSAMPVLNGSSGKRKLKPRMPSQAFVFPFKRLLNRTSFKRKSHKFKTQ